MHLSFHTGPWAFVLFVCSLCYKKATTVLPHNVTHYVTHAWLCIAVSSILPQASFRPTAGLSSSSLCSPEPQTLRLKRRNCFGLRLKVLKVQWTQMKVILCSESLSQRRRDSVNAQWLSGDSKSRQLLFPQSSSRLLETRQRGHKPRTSTSPTESHSHRTETPPVVVAVWKWPWTCCAGRIRSKASEESRLSSTFSCRRHDVLGETDVHNVSGDSFRFSVQCTYINKHGRTPQSR